MVWHVCWGKQVPVLSWTGCNTLYLRNPVPKAPAV